MNRRASVDDDWGPATQLEAPINNWSGDLGAELSPDGRWLFFTSDRGGSWGLWVAHRRTRTATWESVTRLPNSVNQGGSVWPSVSPDEEMLYYAVTFQSEPELDIWQVPIEAFPPLGDYDDDGELLAPDINAVSQEVRMGSSDLRYDVSEDRILDDMDRAFWVHALKQTWFGDANLDGFFDSSDFVDVFVLGKYETEQSAEWAEGDWDGDGIFGSGDFVVAFEDGGYEQGLLPTELAAVPEPSGWQMALSAFLLIFVVRAAGRRSSRENLHFCIAE